MVSLGIFIGMIPFYPNALGNHIKVSRKKSKIIISLVGVVLTIALLLIIRRFAFWLLETISSTVAGNKTDIIVRDLNLTYSSGRGIIWLYSLKASVSSIGNAIFGTSPAGVIDYMGIISNGANPQYTHNQILEVLVEAGYIGLIIFLAWLFVIARKSIQIGVLSKDADFRKRFIPLIVLSCIISNMFESILLFYPFLMGEIFVFLCGYISGSQVIIEKKS